MSRAITRNRQVNVNVSGELLEKLEEIRSAIGEISINKTILHCIKYAYEGMNSGNGSSEDNISIILTYRKTMKELRQELTEKTKKILKTKNRQEQEVLREEIRLINYLIYSNRNSAKTDGELNDILFDPSAKVRLAMDIERNRIADEKNLIMQDNLKHKINMDVISRTGGILNEDDA